jgi:uncharacterized protein with PIN domain
VTFTDADLAIIKRFLDMHDVSNERRDVIEALIELEDRFPRRRRRSVQRGAYRYSLHSEGVECPHCGVVVAYEDLHEDTCVHEFIDITETCDSCGKQFKTTSYWVLQTSP